MRLNDYTKGLIIVIIGAIFECSWAYYLKYAASAFDFCVLCFSVIVSFFAFIYAFKFLPTSIAYSVYVGLGAFFIVLAEMIKENDFNAVKIFLILTLCLGVLGLKNNEKAQK